MAGPLSIRTRDTGGSIDLTVEDPCKVSCSQTMLTNLSALLAFDTEERLGLSFTVIGGRSVPHPKYQWFWYWLPRYPAFRFFAWLEFSYILQYVLSICGNRHAILRVNSSNGCAASNMVQTSATRIFFWTWCWPTLSMQLVQNPSITKILYWFFPFSRDND